MMKKIEWTTTANALGPFLTWPTDAHALADTMVREGVLSSNDQPAFITLAVAAWEAKHGQHLEERSEEFFQTKLMQYA